MQSKNYFLILFLLTWSGIIRLIYLLLRVLSFLGNRRAREWTEPRKSYKKILTSLKKIRTTERPIVLAMTSSAGEYEQILPVLERLRSKGWMPVIIFLSSSGLRYAEARHEEIPWFPSPLDSFFLVKKFFNLLRPNLVLVARQELWPNFLYRARQEVRLALLDASAGERIGKTSKWTKKFLLSFFHEIHCVSKEDMQWFKDQFQLDLPFYNSGDTKYDRVIERLENSTQQRQKLLEHWKNKFGNKNVFLLGSAWPADLDLVLKSLPSLEMPDLQIVVVPHQPTKEIISIMEQTLELHGRKISFYSSETITNDSVIIVDSMGILFELYEIASWVWVGGAVHHQVHNVLEPAVRGLPISHGLRYQNSHEAINLVNQALSLATDTPAELANWIQSTAPKFNPKLYRYMRSQAGASDRILQNLNVDQLNLEIKYAQRKDHHYVKLM